MDADEVIDLIQRAIEHGDTIKENNANYFIKYTDDLDNTIYVWIDKYTDSVRTAFPKP